jgi:hypothetical protein
MTDPWPCCSRPPGWRRAKEQKKLEFERERERDREMTKENCVPRKHKSRKNGSKILLSYFAQQKRPLSFSHPFAEPSRYVSLFFIRIFHLQGHIVSIAGVALTLQAKIKCISLALSTVFFF